MPNMTLAIDNETMERMKKHPEIKWSSVVRTVIKQRLEDFEVAEKLAQKSFLTEKDVEMLTKKSEISAAKLARKLLNESNR